MPHDSQNELERLQAQFDEQSVMLEAAFAECERYGAGFPVNEADLQRLDELCSVEVTRVAPRAQGPMFGTRC